MRPVVGLDCQKILSPTGGGAGIEHYTYHLVLNLAKIKDPFCDFKLYFHPAIEKTSWLKNLNLGSKTEIRFWPRETMQRSGLWPYGKYRRQANFLLAEKLDLFHGPANVTPLFYRPPTVVTIHDLIIYEHPEWFPGGLSDYFWRHSLVPNSINHASKIIAVSRATKRQVVEQFDVSPDKISVVPEGATTARSDDTTAGSEIESLKGKICSGKFLLYVGTIEPRKNLTRLIEAFALATEKEHSLKLVLAGKFGWKYESILAGAKNFKSRIIFTDYISPAQKSWLYSNALGFVYPSLAEGFGLPVLDAMSNRLPVVTSSISSLPEIAGTAAVYVDPLSVGSIAAGLKKIIYDEKLRRELITRGISQAEKFSWTRSAGLTLDTYKEIISNKHD